LSTLNPTAQQFIDFLPDETADALMVDIAAQAMRDKLAKKRADGRGGWHTSTADDGALRRMLVEHCAKGDPVDVMNLAAMLYVRGRLYRP
jgi:hypothetical protein